MNRKIIGLTVAYLMLGFLFAVMFYPDLSRKQALLRGYVTLLFPFGYGVYQQIQLKRNTKEKTG